MAHRKKTQHFYRPQLLILLSLSHDEREELFDLGDARAVDAVLCGQTKGEVARAFGVDRGTLYRWVNRYEHGGANGLPRKVGSGRPRKLEALDEDELRGIVLQPASAFGQTPQAKVTGKRGGVAAMSAISRQPSRSSFVSSASKTNCIAGGDRLFASKAKASSTSTSGGSHGPSTTAYFQEDTPLTLQANDDCTYFIYQATHLTEIETRKFGTI